MSKLTQVANAAIQAFLQKRGLNRQVQQLKDQALKVKQFTSGRTRALYKEIENGKLQENISALLDQQRIFEAQAHIRLLKSKGLAGLQALQKTSTNAAASVGGKLLKASAALKDEQELQGEIKLQYPSIGKAQDLLNGIQGMIDVGLIGKNDFSLSGELKTELGDKLFVALEGTLKSLVEAWVVAKGKASLLNLRQGQLLHFLLRLEAGIKIEKRFLVGLKIGSPDWIEAQIALAGEVTIDCKASFQGEAKVEFTSITLQATAQASAQAKVEVKAVGGAFVLGKLGVKGEVGLQGEAKAEAQAKGSFIIKPKEGTLDVQGHIGASATATAYVFARGGLSYKELSLANATIKGGVATGAGGSAGGGVSVTGGNLKIQVDLSAAFEGGGSGALEVELKFGDIGRHLKTVVQAEYQIWQKFCVKDGETYFQLNDEFDSYLLLQAIQNRFVPIIKDFPTKGLKEREGDISQSMTELILQLRKEDIIPQKKAKEMDIYRPLIQEILEVELQLSLQQQGYELTRIKWDDDFGLKKFRAQITNLADYQHLSSRKDGYIQLTGEKDILTTEQADEIRKLVQNELAKSPLSINKHLEHNSLKTTLNKFIQDEAIPLTVTVNQCEVVTIIEQAALQMKPNEDAEWEEIRRPQIIIEKGKISSLKFQYFQHAEDEKSSLLSNE